MVFLHGGGVSGWMWDKQTAYFSDHYCIVPDLPGHGQSMLNEPFSIQRTAEELNQFLERYSEGREMVVVGFSLGAQVLVEMINQSPAFIDYAMINSALVRPIGGIKPFIGPSVRLTFPLIKNRTFSKLQAKTLYVGEDDFEKYYVESVQMRIGTLISVLEENMSYSIPNGFKSAKTNMLVTVGEKERGMMKKSALQLKAGNHKVEAVSFTGIGHGASMAQPELFNQVLSNWLNQSALPEEVSIIR